MLDRFSALDDFLDFIIANGGRSKTKEEAIIDTQLYVESQRAARRSQPPTARAFIPKSLDSIRGLEVQIPHLRRATSRIDAFDRFAAIEEELEPVEDCVNEVVGQIDEAIQLDIDCARGK